MSLAPKLASIAADHERWIDTAHETAANNIVQVCRDELARFNLTRHTLTIGSYGLLIDGDHLHNHRIMRSDKELATTLAVIHDAVADSVIPNRYFKDRTLTVGQRGKV